MQQHEIKKDYLHSNNLTRYSWAYNSRNKRLEEYTYIHNITIIFEISLS